MNRVHALDMCNIPQAHSPEHPCGFLLTGMAITAGAITPEQTINLFLDAAWDQPGTVASLDMLQKIHFLPREPLVAQKAALVTAISGMLHQKHLDQPGDASETSSSPSSSVHDPQASTALSLEHVPKLLKNISRAARSYPQIRTTVVKHERSRLKHLFEVSFHCLPCVFEAATTLTSIALTA